MNTNAAAGIGGSESQIYVPLKVCNTSLLLLITSDAFALSR